MLCGKRKTESESALLSITMLSCERKSESTPLVELAHENHKLKQKLSTAESRRDETVCVKFHPSKKFSKETMIVHLIKLSYL